MERRRKSNCNYEGIVQKISVCRRQVGLSLTPKCKLSHFFLSPAVNQWIKERVKHEKCAKQWIKGWDWRKRSRNYKNENKSPRHKKHSRSAPTTNTVVLSALCSFANLSSSSCGICSILIFFWCRSISRYKIT